MLTTFDTTVSHPTAPAGPSSGTNGTPVRAARMPHIDPAEGLLLLSTATNVRTVKGLLRQGADPTARVPPFDSIPLLEAAGNLDLKIVDLYLYAITAAHDGRQSVAPSFDVNVRNGQGETALHLVANAALGAVETGDARELWFAREVTRQLLSGGAKVDIVCHKNETAWMRLPRGDAAAALDEEPRATLKELTHMLGFPLVLNGLGPLSPELVAHIFSFLKLEDVRNVGSSSFSVAACASDYERAWEAAEKIEGMVGELPKMGYREGKQAVGAYAKEMMKLVKDAKYLKYIPVSAIGRSYSEARWGAILEAFVSGVASLRDTEQLGAPRVQEGYARGINAFLDGLEYSSDPRYPKGNEDLIARAQVLGTFPHLQPSLKVIAALDGRKALFELHNAIQGERSSDGTQGKETQGKEWALGIAQRIERIPEGILSSTVISVLNRAVLDPDAKLSTDEWYSFAVLYLRSVAREGEKEVKHKSNRVALQAVSEKIRSGMNEGSLPIDLVQAYADVAAFYADGHAHCVMAGRATAWLTARISATGASSGSASQRPAAGS